MRSAIVLLLVFAAWTITVPASAASVAAAPSNPEMKAIFDADQSERQADKVNWEALAAADKVRRARTATLLSQGALHSGDDYLEAAFVFQHGDSANDYLLAHILATVAVNKGSKNGVWIAAATLDRYLLKIGQKQILGTQYITPQFVDPKASGPWTQEPYDRVLISDALRKELEVPPQAEQAEELKKMIDRR